MTREEAIASYEKLYAYMVEDDDVIELDYGEFMELNHYIRSALSPVSREQVEKVWTGCEKCHNQDNWPSWIEKGFVYCPKCGTPLTSWAWEKQMERLEGLK